jgi:hypothetical protein
LRFRCGVGGCGGGGNENSQTQAGDENVHDFPFDFIFSSPISKF